MHRAWERFLTKAKPYAMIAPAMIFLMVFTIYPMVDLLYLSFFKFKLVRPDLKTFCGLDNYNYLLFGNFLNSTWVKTLWRDRTLLSRTLL